MTRLERVCRALAEYNHQNPDEPTVLRWSETNKFKRVSSALEEGPTWMLYRYEALKEIAIHEAIVAGDD